MPDYDFSIMDHIYCERCGRTYSLKELSGLWTQCPCCGYYNGLGIKHADGTYIERNEKLSQDETIVLVQMTRWQIRERYAPNMKVRRIPE